MIKVYQYLLLNYNMFYVSIRVNLFAWLLCLMSHSLKKIQLANLNKFIRIHLFKPYFSNHPLLVGLCDVPPKCQHWSVLHTLLKFVCVRHYQYISSNGE